MASLNDLVWFNVSDGINDTQIVLNFLKETPGNLREVFNNESFRVLLDKDYNPYGIDSGQFFDALKEAEYTMYRSIDSTQSEFQNDPTYEDIFADQLTNIGYTGASLRLKVSVLNKLWTEVKNALNAAGQVIIDFAAAPVVKTLRKFLVFLNSCLGSLSHVIIGADAIKEIKEIAESYIAIAD